MNPTVTLWRSSRPKKSQKLGVRIVNFDRKKIFLAISLVLYKESKPMFLLYDTWKRLQLSMMSNHIEFRNRFRNKPSWFEEDIRPKRLGNRLDFLKTFCTSHFIANFSLSGSEPVTLVSQIGLWTALNKYSKVWIQIIYGKT